MIRVVVFTIFLVASPTLGLVRTLFQSETNCYSGCHSNYPFSVSQLEACQNGCDFKLQKANCADHCKLLSIDEQIQASCVVGCSMNHPMNNEQSAKPKSIIIIRLRQRPFSKDNTAQIFNDIIELIKRKSKSSELKSLENMVQNISPIKSSEIENTYKYKHLIIHREDTYDHFPEFMKTIHSKWDQLVHKNSRFPGWILFSLTLLLSAILCYKIISLCRNKHDLSIRAQELILEKELLQSDTSVKTI